MRHFFAALMSVVFAATLFSITPRELFLRARALEEASTPDSLAAIALYRQAADSGYAPAQGYLGVLLFEGKIVPPDTAQAISFFLQAAAGGDARSANNLGWLYANGIALPQNDLNAAMWWRKAADAGLPAAQMQLAALYLNGRVAPLYPLEPLRLLTIASCSGFKDARNKLAEILGDTSLPPDILAEVAATLLRGKSADIAVVLLKPLSQKNHPRATALLAEAYARGRGTKRDSRLSTELYYKAASLGNAPAQFILAELIDEFPDALTGIAPDGEHLSASYLRDEASAGGVSTASEAARKLYDTPSLDNRFSADSTGKCDIRK